MTAIPRTTYNKVPFEAPAEPPLLPGLELQIEAITATTAQTMQKAALDATKRTVGEWQHVVYDRLGRSRLEKQNQPSAESSNKVDEDMQTAKSYKLLCGEWKEFCKKPVSGDCLFLIVTDSEQRTQGLALLALHTDVVAVKLLMSAPWNIRMHGSNAPEHDLIKKSGVGTTVMRHAHEFAKRTGKATIELKPLGGSYTFYRDHLKMTSSIRDDGLYFILDVTKDIQF